jgi:transcriptional antiterminator RfaH
MRSRAVSKKPEQVTQHNKHWCAVYTKPQREEFAEVNLHLRRIETFFPKLFLPKSAKRKKHIVALFPNYLFVCIDVISVEYASVIWCPGVKRMVTFNGTPAIVEESIIAFLMGQAGADGVISARCNVTVGQQVAINGGPFDGLTGIIEEPPNAKGRVKVLLRFLNRPTKAEIPVELVNSGWVGANA